MRHSTLLIPPPLDPARERPLLPVSVSSVIKTGHVSINTGLFSGVFNRPHLLGLVRERLNTRLSGSAHPMYSRLQRPLSICGYTTASSRSEDAVGRGFRLPAFDSGFRCLVDAQHTS